jgi:esterase/lipase
VWEFLSSALEKGGLVGLSLAGVFAMFTVVVKALWNTNQAQARQLRDERETCAKQLQDMQQQYATMTEELYEKRVEEAKAVTDRIVMNTTELHKAIDKLSSAMETLIELQRGGRR